MKTPLILAALAAASIATLAPAPVIAQPVEQGSRITVGYSDLNLASRAGRAALDRRIRTAAQLACGTQSDADPAGKNDNRECLTQTIAQARSQSQNAIALARRDGPTVLASGQ